MFTGLIEGLGQVEKLERKGPDVLLWLKPPWPVNDVVMGESVAVNGACLTVTRITASGFAADVSAETLRRSSLGQLQSGSLVNLERALRLSDRLGGHLVSGHVDCLGQIRELKDVGASLRITIAIAAAHMRYVVEKGSVAIDGISLTVNEVSAGSFNVNIIPHTMGETTLQLVKAGQYVNIETDLLAKYVEKLLTPGQQGNTGGLTFQDLADMGFR